MSAWVFAGIFCFFEDNPNSLLHCHSLHLPGKGRQPWNPGARHTGPSTCSKAWSLAGLARRRVCEISKEQFWKTYKEGTCLPDGDSCGSRGSDPDTAGHSRNLLKN